MPVTMKKSNFPTDEAWEEHKKITKDLGCRYYDWEQQGTTTLVFYKKGIADYSFMVRYRLDGDNTLFVEQPSFDNIKTLESLLSELP